MIVVHNAIQLHVWYFVALKECQSLTSLQPESSSSRAMRMCPSCMSRKRSWTSIGGSHWKWMERKGEDRKKNLILVFIIHDNKTENIFGPCPLKMSKQRAAVHYDGNVLMRGMKISCCVTYWEMWNVKIVYLLRQPRGSKDKTLHNTQRFSSDTELSAQSQSVFHHFCDLKCCCVFWHAVVSWPSGPPSFPAICSKDNKGHSATINTVTTTLSNTPQSWDSTPHMTLHSAPISTCLSRN